MYSVFGGVGWLCGSSLHHSQGWGAMQASETVFKGMQDFVEGPIGEGPPVEDRGIYFQGGRQSLCMPF